jgi:hypothetical protein
VMNPTTMVVSGPMPLLVGMVDGRAMSPVVLSLADEGSGVAVDSRCGTDEVPPEDTEEAVRMKVTASATKPPTAVETRSSVPVGREPEPSNAVDGNSESGSGSATAPKARTGKSRAPKKQVGWLIIVNNKLHPPPAPLALQISARSAVVR